MAFNSKCKFMLISFFTCVFMLLSACTSNNDIWLCDYKNIQIPDNVMEVSSNDVNFSIKMQLVQNDVIVPKKNDDGIVKIEEDDIVNIDLSTKQGDMQHYIIVVGEETLGEEFDNLLLGKERGDVFVCDINNIEYSAKVDEIRVYTETLTDEIAKEYFDCESVREVVANTKEDILKHRIFEYMYHFLISESMIRGYYKERESYTQSVVQQIIAEAGNYGYTTSEALECFFKEEYGITLSEYQANLEEFFDEYLILCEFMRKENAEVTDSEFEDYIAEHLENFDGDDENFSLEVYGREFVLYSIYYEKSYDILLQYSKLF